jgi:catechol 2,3-dioxygenase-like lactoylglutathione lyase family enzyme
LRLLQSIDRGAISVRPNGGRSEDARVHGPPINKTAGHSDWNIRWIRQQSIRLDGIGLRAGRDLAFSGVAATNGPFGLGRHLPLQEVVMHPIAGFDHIAIPVSDVAAAYAFYRDVLGAVAPFEADFLAGKTPILRIEIGGVVINLHRSPAEHWLVAAAPTVGGADLCFRWREPLATAVERLAAAGVEIIEGPVPRRASNGAAATSVYFRDPDKNLLELLSVG